MSLQRLEEALAVWEACLKVNPKQPVLREDVNRIRKELAERHAANPPPVEEPLPAPDVDAPITRCPALSNMAQFTG